MIEDNCSLEKQTTHIKCDMYLGGEIFWTVPSGVKCLEKGYSSKRC